VKTSFLPSRHGLHFDNAFPDGPALTFKLGSTSLGIGNAANGLCGGMVFTALDFWTRGLTPPSDTDPPAPGTPLFRHLVRRLIDSWHLPGGPLAYFVRMTPWVPLPDRRLSAGMASQWSSIKAELDAGRPCPLGLVRVKSANPLHLGQNHQVLAYGYHLAGPSVRLEVYDPNQADADNVALCLDLHNPSRIVMTLIGEEPQETGSAVLSFFRVQYHPKTPPLRP
jgi:hypothetical protein